MMRRFGKNLVAARIVKNYLNAADFAKALDIGEQRYRKYERGESMPPIDVLREMRRLLGVTLDWLVLNEAIAPERSIPPADSMPPQ